MGDRRSAYRVLEGDPDRKRPTERHERRWKDNNKIDLKEISWEAVDWIDLAQDMDI
jgi:hypothetical protein